MSKQNCKKPTLFSSINMNKFCLQFEVEIDFLSDISSGIYWKISKVKNKFDSKRFCH